jgi:aldose 1-epimerase
MIELRSERATVTIDPTTGGRLVSLVIDGHDVIGAVPTRTVIELVGDRVEARHDWYRGSFPLAPWAGALRDGAFMFDGAHYRVELDGAGTAQHGVVAERPWEIDGAADSRAVTLSTSFGPDLPGGWPFDGRAVQSFVLEESALLVRLEVHSSGQRMPAIAGFHPWFRYELDDGATASIVFSPTSRLVQRAGRMVATNDLGQRPWDDAFVGLTGPPSISWVGGPNLRLESDAQVWVYYEQLPGAFCIEPWTGPFDSIETEWATVVTPGQPLVLNFAIRFD